MVRAFVLSLVVLWPAAAVHARDGAPPAVRLAKAGKKKKKAPEKPAEKATPEGARTDPRTAPPDEAPARRGGVSRIEFDDRLVQGETNKANAIYLFERRESAMRSLLKKRTDFHEKIDEILE